MDNKDKEDVKQKSSDTSAEDNSPDEGEKSPEEGEAADENSDNKVPYSRFKEVNETKKELENKIEALEQNQGSDEEESESPSSSDLDVDNYLKMKEATEGLERDEIDYLRDYASAKSASLSEAREDDNFQIWLEAKREKTKKTNQTPEPDSRKPSEDKNPEDYTEEDLKNLSDDELLELAEEEKKQKM